MPINPETVRLEVQALKSDFNSRLKQIMFNAIVSTYYATFIPCVFVPNALSYETPWVFRHVSNWIESFGSLGTIYKCQSNYRVERSVWDKYVQFSTFFKDSSFHVFSWAFINNKVILIIPFLRFQFKKCILSLAQKSFNEFSTFYSEIFLTL